MADNSSHHGDASHGGHEGGSWIRRGVRHAAAGYLFSLLLSFVLVALVTLRFPPIVSLERSGVDFGMAVFSAIQTVPDHGAAGGYVFLDIDTPACLKFAGATPSRCDSGTPAPVELIGPLLAAMDRDRAAVIIVDVTTPSDRSERRRLYDALIRVRNSPVIAPLETRPADAVREAVGARSGNVTSTWAEGRVRLASVSAFTDPYSSDFVIRGVPVATRIRRSGEAGSDWAPSAAFLAAALASTPANSAAADCAFYRIGAACPPRSRIVLNGHVYDFRATGEPEADVIRDTGFRIFFSLPPLTSRQLLSTADPGETRRADRFRGFYDVYPASQFLIGDQIVTPPGLFTGKSVIIGSSAPAANDLHATPLGGMAGSEVLLNAVRAFRDFAPMEQTTPSTPLAERLTEGGSLLLEKFGAATLAALILLPAWLAASAIGQRTRESRWPVRAAGVVASFGVVVIFLVVGLVVELTLFATGLEVSARKGAAIDLVMPVVALGLEAYGDAADVLLDAMHRSVLALEVWVGAALIAGGRWVRRRRPESRESDDD